MHHRRTPVPESGSFLAADAEGLALAYGDGRTLLLASSQGDSRFVLFDVEPPRLRHLGGFRVVAGASTDGVEHSDGAAVVTEPVGSRFPTGLLVVHDGRNTPYVADPEGGTRPGTDFKYLAWGDVVDSVVAPLAVP